MITRHIADLLFHTECVIVPGLGGFIKAFTSSRIIHDSHRFYPPSGSIAFNAGLSANDGQLANYIAFTENISYREALAGIQLWAGVCVNSLNNGDKVVLDGIGDLFINASGKIEFTPYRQHNFNADSFGLPVFFAKPTATEQVILPDVLPVTQSSKGASLRRLIPETLKWAAVLAPFIAFALWGSLKGNIVDNYVHNYTGMYSWVRSTPGKTAPVKFSYPQAAKETPAENIKSPAAILATENISFDPGMLSYTELAKYDIKIEGNQPVAVASVAVTGQEYHIVGGAFRDHNNAMNLISMLQQKGYPAAIIDTTPGGLYVVSMKGFNSYDEAINQLSEVKKAGFTSSWILKKRDV